MPSWVAALLLFGQLALCRRPNILFILTDDQDLHMESVEHMPYLKDLIVKEGTTYGQHYCTVALCCPSRATLWTGRAAHNHNVTNVSPPHGGYPKVVSQGINDDNLFLWMQEAGFNTYYVGKLWNFHAVDNYDRPHARGFNGSDFLLDPYTYQYWNAMMTHNGEEPVSYAGQYSTDVVAQKALKWLDEALQEEDPFFLTVSPIAPHSNWVIQPEKDLSYLEEPKPAPRHEKLFQDYSIPRDNSFNAPISGGVSWIKSLPALNKSVLAYNDHYQRQRLRSLQAVDEMVSDLVDSLEKAGQLENTYIFYTTDNGYHISQHRMNPGKECGYDTDIHIPFFVRGPGISRGGKVDIVTTHTDVSSTLLEIAGVKKQLDGTAMPLKPTVDLTVRSEHASIEYWGPAVPEGVFGGRGDKNREAGTWHNYYPNNTYKGLRIVSEEYSLYYSVWCTNETELFDLKFDPYQTKSLAAASNSPSAYRLAKRPLHHLLSRLNALIMVLKTCKDRVCTHPWNTLHPNGDVQTLKQALDEKYDKFYANQPQMWFAECSLGYFADMENQEPQLEFIVINGGLDPLTAQSSYGVGSRKQDTETYKTKPLFLLATLKLEALSNLVSNQNKRLPLGGQNPYNMSNTLIVLPRPGASKSGDEQRPIQAPSEASFVATFGNLLPPASYLSTPNGKAAYYELLPSFTVAEAPKSPVTRVIFVHGVQTPAIGLQPLASVLSSRFPYAHCVLLDLWGHGLTDTPFVAHDPALFHALLEALMTQLGWNDAHFVGYSFGGSLTATFAAAHPERVSSMVLVAPAGLLRSANFDELQNTYLRGGEGLEEQAQAWILEWLEGGPLIVPSDWRERVARGEVVAEAVKEWQLKEHAGHSASIVGVFRDGGALDKHAEFAEAAKKGIQGLCILGELDGVCSAQDLQDVGMRNVAILPQVGHGVVRQRVPEVAGLIEDFWNKL
ncbi:Arylsulfatase [Neonectria ditissima]|uniref:Arylsulfatase n=1 Tax=Neonectria ditissima TaxID=78410 RepID=A0A0P7APH1_9HYPO|nr:Arylsulfatase [Neonectria ditissima]